MRLLQTVCLRRSVGEARSSGPSLRMCHNWFWIDYFRLNLHLIIEIFVHICWRSEFIIARPLYWEITRNNPVNYFEFCPVFDKDSLHFRKGDASAPPLWQVPIWILYIFFFNELKIFKIVSVLEFLPSNAISHSIWNLKCFNVEYRSWLLN